MKSIFKIASLLAAAVMLFACEKPDNGDPNGGDDPNTVTPGGSNTSGDFRIVTDKDVIQSNGTDAATIKVMLGDEDVTSKSVIYNEKKEALELPGMKFTATKDGSYKFWASYGTFSTFDKKKEDNGLMTIKAIPVPVPSAAKDSEPSNTSFSRKIFLAQMTGTGCGYCPAMVYILRPIMESEEWAGKIVHTAVHSYNNNDPAYISAPSSGAMGGSGYPFLSIDMAYGYADYTNDKYLKSALNEAYNAASAKAGISVNSVIEGEYLIAKVAVKASADGEFAVGAWLLEDGIYGKQSDYMGVIDADKEHDYDYHNNCVRVVDSKSSATSFAGHPLGTIKAGSVVEKTFVMSLKSNWKVENMHLAVFVSTPDNNGYYTVNNAVDCGIDTEVPFVYAK